MAGSKSPDSEPRVKHPIFQLKLGEKIHLDVNEDGCFGIAGVAFVVCVCGSCAVGPQLPEIVAKILGK